MTKQERILSAIERIISEFGYLREDGIPADSWHRHMHDLRSAAWKAYDAQREIVAKQKAENLA
jgi:hypothetical protein